MTTVREALDDLGFDWESGIVIHQKFEYVWDTNRINTSFVPVSAKTVGKDDPVMEMACDELYTKEGDPVFIAADDVAIYVLGENDEYRYRRLYRIFKDVRRYLWYSDAHIPIVSA